ncbi:hypothetical protein VPH35_035867 [Triticum aestivum]
MPTTTTGRSRAQAAHAPRSPHHHHDRRRRPRPHATQRAPPSSPHLASPSQSASFSFALHVNANRKSPLFHLHHHRLLRTNLPPHHHHHPSASAPPLARAPDIKPATSLAPPVPASSTPFLSFFSSVRFKILDLPEMAAAVAASCGRKCKCEELSAPELGQLHEDMLERVLARLPPASFFRLRGVCRRWREAAGSPAFLAACARVPARDPWFLMLSDQQEEEQRPPCPAVAFDAAEKTWARCRGAPGPVPVAAAGGLVLYRARETGALTVANPLSGVSRALPPPPPAATDALYGSPYRVVLILGELPHLSMMVFDSSKNA